MKRYGPVLLGLTLLLGCTTPLEAEEEPEEAVVIERADFYGSWQWLISFNEDGTRSWTPETVGYSISSLFKEGITYDTTFYYRNGTFMKSEPYQLLERDGQWILEYSPNAAGQMWDRTLVRGTGDRQPGRDR